MQNLDGKKSKLLLHEHNDRYINRPRKSILNTICIQPWHQAPLKILIRLLQRKFVICWLYKAHEMARIFDNVKTGASQRYYNGPIGLSTLVTDKQVHQLNSISCIWWISRIRLISSFIVSFGRSYKTPGSTLFDIDIETSDPTLNGTNCGVNHFKHFVEHTKVAIILRTFHQPYSVSYHSLSGDRYIISWWLHSALSTRTLFVEMLALRFVNFRWSKYSLYKFPGWANSCGYK